MLDVQTAVDIVTTVGFPIAVSTYLLYERDHSTKELTKAIHSLTEAVKEHMR